MITPEKASQKSMTRSLRSVHHTNFLRDAGIVSAASEGFEGALEKC